MGGWIYIFVFKKISQHFAKQIDEIETKESILRNKIFPPNPNYETLGV